MNEGLLAAEVGLCFGLVLLFWRCFGRTGVTVWIALATVLANIQVAKTVVLFGMTATLGNILYASTFLATDILSELHGRKAAFRGVLLGMAAMLATLPVMGLAIAFAPAPDDFADGSIRTLFHGMPRVVGASLLAYIVSQGFDVVCYDAIRNRFPGVRMLWLRNTASTFLSQALDTLIFTAVAFAGLYPPEVFWSIAGTTFLFKAFAALCDTPFLYLVRWLAASRRKAPAPPRTVRTR